MGWFIRKSVRMGPVRFNLSKHGIGTSVSVKGFRIGKGPRGSYVAGGRGGLYFRQRLGGHGRPAPQPASQHLAPPPTAPATYPIERAAAPPTAPATYPIPHTWLLVALGAGYALGFVLGFVLAGTGDSIVSNVGVTLLLIVIAVICVLDWHGLWSLRGRVRWGEMSGLGHFWLVVAYVCLWPFLAVPYLVLAFKDDRADRQQEARALPHRIGALEAELGIMPPTEGTCRVCAKPLQAGADFCEYCGAPVVERPQVCPTCGATALPDARYCPKCATPLGTRE